MTAGRYERRSVNLTEGNIIKNIILFALPLLAGQLFQNLYNSVDSIVVGRAVGVTALAAVTSCSDISQVIIGFFTGLSVGAGVAFSRYFGAGNRERLHESIHTSLTFAMIMGMVMLVIGELLSPLLLRIVSCPEDVYPEAMVYLRIYLIGIIFTSMYNVQAGVLRSVGDSRSPFIFLVCASLTNIVLDILFVVVLHMGVAGVAFATILSQSESFFLVTRKMLRTDDVYRLVPQDLKVNVPLLLEILQLGIPAAIQSCLVTFSNLFVQRYINSFGTYAMAGAGAGKKIDNYISQITVSLGQSCTTYVGQCVGAEKYERAFKGIRYVIFINLVVYVCLAVPLYFLAPQAASLFTNNPEAISYAVTMMHTLLPLYFLQSFHQVLSNSVRGFGKSTVTMITTITSLIFIRQLYLAIAMHINHDIRLVFISWPVGWTCSTLLAFTYYYFTIKRPYLNQQKQA